MTNTYANLIIHYIFSTKNRNPLLADSFRNQVFRYMAGICKDEDMHPIAIGGIANHAHALVGLPPRISVSRGNQLINGLSSKWVNDQFITDRSFAWQSGYGAFNVGVSQLEATKRYIHNQEQHHRTKTFREEYLEILDLHNIDYDRA